MICSTNQKINFRTRTIDLYSETNLGQSADGIANEATQTSSLNWRGVPTACCLVTWTSATAGTFANLGQAGTNQGKLVNVKTPLEASSVTMKGHNKTKTNKLLLLLREGTHVYAYFSKAVWESYHVRFLIKFTTWTVFKGTIQWHCSHIVALGHHHPIISKCVRLSAPARTLCPWNGPSPFLPHFPEEITSVHLLPVWLRDSGQFIRSF